MPRLSKEWYALCVARAKCVAGVADTSPEYVAWGQAFRAWDDALKKQGLTYTHIDYTTGKYNYLTSDGEKYLESEPL